MDFPHTTVFMRYSKLCIFCNSTFSKSQFILNYDNYIEQNNILKLTPFFQTHDTVSHYNFIFRESLRLYKVFFKAYVHAVVGDFNVFSRPVS